MDGINPEDVAEIVEPEPPQPLTRVTPAAKPYPINALGPLKPAAEAIQDLTQAPIEIAANSVLATTALACQGHANITTLDGLDKPISLYFLTIAGSSERKSTCDTFALRAVLDREADLRRDYDAALKGYKRAKLIYDKAVQEALKPGGNALDKQADLAALQDPVEPIEPVLRVSDQTLEGLFKLFERAGPSLGLFTNEGGVFVGGHGMNDDNKLKTAAGLSGFWDGQPVTRVRSGDGTSTLVGRRLSLHLMAQPDVAARLLSDPVLRDQGLLSRLLVTVPASTVGTRFWREPSPASHAALGQFHDAIARLLLRPPPLMPLATRILTPPTLALTADAKQTLVAFHDAVEQRMADELAPIKDFAGKLPEHALRLAAVQALYENPNGSTLTRAAMARGINLAHFYASEALRLREAVVPHESVARAETLRQWLIGTWRGATISVRECLRFGPNALRDKYTAENAIAVLVDHGWLAQASAATSGIGTRRGATWRVVRP